MKIRGIIITTVVILAIVAVSTTTAAALSCSDDICVDPTGWWRDGGAFNASGTPIQAAVSNATAGETICVAAGSYSENVDITTSHLTLRGAGADVVTVTAASSSDHVFDVTGTWVNISGFAATGTDYPYAGIYLDGADHCNISENNCSDNVYGISLDRSSDNTLANNIASSNGGHGISLDYSSDNTLVSNTASSNYYFCGIWLHCSSNNALTNNYCSSNIEGIWLHSSSNYNTLVSNTASSNKHDGIYLYCSSDNTLDSNTANSNNCSGIRIDGSSRDNDVTCNLVQNNTDCGIFLTIWRTGNNIAWNNIVANGELQTDGSYHYQFNNSYSADVDAINNFWGTGMNNDTIDASIYDDEEGRTEVKFHPFETEPVPCAPAPISEESTAFTIADALIALEMVVGSCPLDLYWDVSGDGQVTSLDALMIVMGTGT